ncbi:MAG: hypothetical protein LBE59_05225 [Nevskiaceae bacterium]|jgi:hypothetical protein|nr:hypothetical protein [Nevskiaceae bacterium]
MAVLLGALAGLLSLPSRAAGNVEVTLDLYSFGGNLSTDQRDALLADPNWTVQARYSPPVKVPGVTASWQTCGLLNLPCLKDRSEQVTLSGRDIRREGTALRFSLPRRVKMLRWRLANVTIELPKTPTEALRPLEASFDLDYDFGSSRIPVFVSGGTFVLAGSLTVPGEKIRAFNSPSDAEIPWRIDARQRYEFMPIHRFAMYQHGYQFDTKSIPLREPLPAELAGLTLYQATLLTREVDGHRVEYAEISADGERQRCGSSGVNYKILYVDGEAISYAHSFAEDAAPCPRGRFLRIVWANEQQPTAFDATLTLWDGGGTPSVSYQSWNLFCEASGVDGSGACNAPPPGAEIQQQAQADARRVRGWFAR